MQASNSATSKRSLSLAIALILSSGFASAQGRPGDESERHFDARIEHNQAQRLQPRSQSKAAIQPSSIESLKRTFRNSL